MKSRALLLAYGGQGLVEYALILVLLAVVIIGALTVMGSSLSDAYQSIIDQLPFH